MSIFVNKDTKVITQGITGQPVCFIQSRCIEYGTKIVGGVTPGKEAGRQRDRRGVPVFNTVEEA